VCRAEGGTQNIPPIRDKRDIDSRSKDDNVSYGE